MLLIAEQIFIVDRPVDEIFCYISDMENFGKWFPGVYSIKASNDLPTGTVGKEYIEKVKVPLQGSKDVTIKVVESISNKMFITEGKLLPLMPRMEVTFEKLSGRQCKVKWQMYSRNNNYIFKFFALPIIKSIVGKRAISGAKNIIGIFQ